MPAVASPAPARPPSNPPPQRPHSPGSNSSHQGPASPQEGGTPAASSKSRHVGCTAPVVTFSAFVAWVPNTHRHVPAAAVGVQNPSPCAPGPPAVFFPLAERARRTLRPPEVWLLPRAVRPVLRPARWLGHCRGGQATASLGLLGSGGCETGTTPGSAGSAGDAVLVLPVTSLGGAGRAPKRVPEKPRPSSSSSSASAEQPGPRAPLTASAPPSARRSFCPRRLGSDPAAAERLWSTPGLPRGPLP